jgi:hypothetical protein
MAQAPLDRQSFAEKRDRRETEGHASNCFPALKLGVPRAWGGAPHHWKRMISRGLLARGRESGAFW